MTGTSDPVAVAGATGFVGSSIVRELLARGRRVIALARSPDKARSVLGSHDSHDSLRIVAGQAHDPASARELVHGAGACINAIGIIREAGGQTFKRAHVDVTRTLVDACLHASARRFVLISALGVTDDSRIPYQNTKFQSEQIVRSSGLDWTIFRPSTIHGAASGFVRMARGWVTGEKPPWRFLPYFTRSEPYSDVPLAAMRRIDPLVQPIAVEDVARCIAEALERPWTIGEVYNIVGPDVLTWPDMLRALRDHIPGAIEDIEPAGIPARSAAAAARAARLLGLGALLPFDEGMALMGGADSTASLDKARAHLDFQPRRFREALAGYAAGVR